MKKSQKGLRRRTRKFKSAAEHRKWKNEGGHLLKTDPDEYYRRIDAEIRKETPKAIANRTEE
jgi:hypothetical protein